MIKFSSRPRTLYSYCLIQDGLAVTLDRRMLKTPNGKHLIVPEGKRLAATLIAHEWDIQDKVLKPHALPLVSSPLVS